MLYLSTFQRYYPCTWVHVFILISLISGKVVLNFEFSRELVPKYFPTKIQLLMIEERIIIFGVKSTNLTILET